MIRRLFWSMVVVAGIAVMAPMSATSQQSKSNETRVECVHPMIAAVAATQQLFGITEWRCNTSQSEWLDAVQGYTADVPKIPELVAFGGSSREVNAYFKARGLDLQLGDNDETAIAGYLKWAVKWRETGDGGHRVKYEGINYDGANVLHGVSFFST